MEMIEKGLALLSPFCTTPCMTRDHPMLSRSSHRMDGFAKKAIHNTSHFQQIPKIG